MWARWCLGSIGGLAEVVRRGDSVGKWDMNNLCGIRGLVGRGGVLLRRWGTAEVKECLKDLLRRLRIAKEREDLACCLLFTYRFGKKLKILKNNIIDKTAGNQRLTMVCGKEEAYEFLELILIIPIFVNVKYWLDKKCYLMSDKVA